MQLINRHSPLLLCLFFLASLLYGCGLLPEQIDETKDWSASRLYAEAKESLNSGDYEDAIHYYEILEARYPFGRYAQQAQLEVAYAYYKYDEPASAVVAADRFIKLYPRHPHVDYAYYLKGLANFNQGLGFIERHLPRDAAQRDPGASRQAFYDFDDLVKRFPNSKYAKDARARMLYLRNTLAAHELRVADYYMRRGAYVAAANRARYVIENFQRTPAVPDALVMLARAYEQMGLSELSADARRVLKLNYPDYPAAVGQANAASGE
jgi:outer membrane protein assembly factor BamD